MHEIELTIDVTGALGLDQQVHIAATVCLPEATFARDRSPVCFAFPGGGYGRRYFTTDLLGASLSQASWHTDRGWVFVAIDHLHVGDSTVLDPDMTTYELIAAANHAAVESVCARLADGNLPGQTGPLINPVVLGIGQSMGGCFTIVAQAMHRLFDGIGVLGYSAINTVVRSKPGSPAVVMPVMSRHGYPDAPRVFNEADLIAAAAVVTDQATLNAANNGDEHVWTWQFHHEDEPADIVARDMAAMSGGATPAWRSATTPSCAILMVAPGTVATEAASIDVPVLIAVGARDVVPDPWTEPKAYPKSSDVSVFVCDRMAHMHNFAPTRERFWSRIHSWGEHVAEQKDYGAQT